MIELQPVNLVVPVPAFAFLAVFPGSCCMFAYEPALCRATNRRPVYAMSRATWPACGFGGTVEGVASGGQRGRRPKADDLRF